MDFGIFIPIGNNGWLISATSPQYMPSFQLNKAIAEKAEEYDFDFLLSMIKLRGFGGKTEFWDHNLESFTLMAGLAAVTEKIQLYGSVATLTMNPAIVARMASTIDDISGGRFGINIVTGWNKSEYDQMGEWPDDSWYDRRYDHAEEYVRIMRELWRDGVSDLKGDFFQMNDCRLSPRPMRGTVPIVCAGQSERGMRFCAEYGDYQFILGDDSGEQLAQHTQQLLDFAVESGRDVGPYALYLVITGDTDKEAQDRYEHYRDGADLDAIAFMSGMAALDVAGSTAAKIVEMKGAFNFNMGKVVGSHDTVAKKLDDLASIKGLKGIMCVFPDFVAGTEDFGRNVMPKLKCR